MIKTIHESYSRDETVGGGSDRSFGIVMAAAFAVISLLNWWYRGLFSCSSAVLSGSIKAGKSTLV
jgi:hypothetical protein